MLAIYQSKQLPIIIHMKQTLYLLQEYNIMKPFNEDIPRLSISSDLSMV